MSKITTKPIPPTTIKSITGIRTSASFAKYERFEKSGVAAPRGSMPALQNAEIAKNNALKQPDQKPPENLIMLGASIKKPANSQIAVIKRICLTVLTMSPESSLLRDSWSVIFVW